MVAQKLQHTNIAAFTKLILAKCRSQGKIGSEKPFSIGRGTEVKPAKKELFYLGYNDDMFGDNIGYYLVDIFEGTENEIKQLLKEKNIEIGNYYYE